MSHTPHELAEEFPDAIGQIHDLKIHDAHFARISDAYHDVNREIHRIESEVDAASDSRLEDLKKHRLQLKDEIYTLLRNSQIAGT